MIQVPCSLDEHQRLASLEKYRILDTLPEQAYDRITRLACRLFSVPICVISLVDEKRQWFKSQHGLETRETDRNIAFCAYAILRNNVMVVEDARDDARFVRNPLVTGPLQMRFYAGAPLRTADGYNIGTIAIIDREPRTLDDREKSTLEDLAGMVMNELELRYNAKALFDANEKLAHQATHDSLTNLANRHLFDRLFHASLLMAAFHHKRVALLYLDLNRFKAVNDEFGHSAGDALLQNFALRVAALIPLGCTFCRIGGDEFAVLLPDLEDDVEPILLAEEIKYAMETPFLVEGRSLDMDVSIGAAIYPRDGDTPHALLQSADAAMYRAKANAHRYNSSNATLRYSA